MRIGSLRSSSPSCQYESRRRAWGVDRRSGWLASADCGLGCSSVCSRDAVDRESGARRRETPRLPAQSRCWTTSTGRAFVDAARLTHNPEVAGSNPAPATNMQFRGPFRTRRGPLACGLLTEAGPTAPVRNKENGPVATLGFSCSSSACRLSHQAVRRFADRDPVGALGDAPVAGDSVGPVEACQQPPVGGHRHLA